MAPSIQNVLILGAGGNVGKVITPVLLDSPLKISVLTRPESESTFDPRANVIKSTYEPAALRKAFEGQDVVISLMGSFNIKSQIEVIDAAADAHVKWFIPSDFGGRTNSPDVVKAVPLFSGKAEVAEHLRSKEASGMSWTSFITGPFLDWCLAYGVFNIDVAKREAKIWSGGDAKWTTTTLPTIGKALVNLLTSPENLDKAKNRYVAIQTSLTSQNEIIAGQEKLTGDKFKVVEEVDADKAGEEGREELSKGDHSVFIKLILAAIFAPAELGNHEKAPGLDNDWLLPGHEEPLEDVLKKVLKSSGQ